MLKIGFMRDKDNTNVITKATQFDGIVQYMYTYDGYKATKLTYDTIAIMKDIYGTEVTIDDMWDTAKANTMADISVFTLGSLFAAMGNDNAPEVFVVTNKSSYLGAACILAEDTLRERGIFGDFFMLPSSIHEVLLVRNTDGIHMDAMTAMVQNVNATEVAYDEQLGDKAYALTI